MLKGIKKLGPEPWYKIWFSPQNQCFHCGIIPGKSIERAEILSFNRKYITR